MRAGADFQHHLQYLRKLIVEDSESKPMVKLENNPNIIAGGRLIRALCFDEIPQLFNVLRGDMSLVGPRPCIPYEAKEYLRWHARRFDSLPGMTGLWQVSGKNRTTFKEMIRLDIKYEQNRSLRTDLKIILLTPLAILRQLIEGKKHPAEKITEKPAGPQEERLY
jgi:lipopolysaccharide/colanic/teichoic acid biosynthesis glycosyltransferase